MFEVDFLLTKTIETSKVFVCTNIRRKFSE